jgi:hypothetical protein
MPSKPLKDLAYFAVAGWLFGASSGVIPSIPVVMILYRRKRGVESRDWGVGSGDWGLGFILLSTLLTPRSANSTPQSALTKESRGGRGRREAGGGKKIPLLLRRGLKPLNLFMRKKKRCISRRVVNQHCRRVSRRR